MCGISRCWLDSMIIAQVCLRLATIKGHSKMCSFSVLGGSKNQSVSGVTTICLTQCNISPSHRVDQVCWLWPVECWSTPLQWLCEVTGYQIKSLLLSHHHSTCALVSEILTSVLQKQFTYRQYILTDLYRWQCAKYTYIYSLHTVYY